MAAALARSTPPGAVFYLSLVLVLGMLAFRFRSDRGRTRPQFVAPIVTVVVFGPLGVVTGRGLAWWAIAGIVAMVALQPGLASPTSEFPACPPSAPAPPARPPQRGAPSPLNALVVVVLAVAAVALLPVWRPLGAAGVPVGILSHAPQDLAVAVPVTRLPLLRQGMGPAGMGILVRVRVPGVTSRWTRESSCFPRRVGRRGTGRDGIGDWLCVLDAMAPM